MSESSPVRIGTKRTLQPEDLFQLATPSDPQINPNGNRVAFVLRTINQVANRYESHIWIASITPSGVMEANNDKKTKLSTALEQWTFGSGETSPRWSPDGGLLAFVQTGSHDLPGDQIFILSISGGEAHRVTKLPVGTIQDLCWRPCGTAVSFRHRERHGKFHSESCSPAYRNESSPPQEITRLSYREDGSGYVPAHPWRVYHTNIATYDSQIIELPEPWTDRDCCAFSWSPDGITIAVVVNGSKDPDFSPKADTLLYLTVMRDTTPQSKSVVTDITSYNIPLGPKRNLAWSPDGKSIAFLGHFEADEVWDVLASRIWLCKVDQHFTDEKCIDLTQNLDVAFGSSILSDSVGNGVTGPIFSPDGLYIYAVASEEGTLTLWRLPILLGTDKGGPTRLLPPPPLTPWQSNTAILGLSIEHSGEQLALLISTTNDVGDIYLLTPKTLEIQRLTYLNEEILRQIIISTPICLEATSGDGKIVKGWALFPPTRVENIKSEKPNKAILYLHGGPQLMALRPAISHELQVLVGYGYIILVPDFRGSKGYGQAWTSDARGNWGEPAASDVLAFVGAASKQKWVDPQSMVVIGASYGAYLAIHLLSTTKLFVTGIAERGVYDLKSMAGTCDFVWRRGYFDANTTDDTQEYLNQSVLRFADNISVPILLLHGEGDLRCPISQSEQLFSALKQSGKDVVFVRYGPEVSHGFSRNGLPDIRLHRLYRIKRWLVEKCLPRI